MLAGIQAVQALTAGNAVVWKPGAGGTPSALAFNQLLDAAGFPPDLLVVLDETPTAAREAIAAGVDKVLVTGSAATGRAVLADLAPRIVPATLELSGCDAVFVLDGADLDLVARALLFGMRMNRGATCLAPRRVFVAEARAVDLEAALVGHRIAEPPIPVEPGRRAALAGVVVEAIERGARRIGPVSEAPPWIVAEARPEMRIMREDAFGPVLALMAVRDEDHALDAASACPYALGASIFGPSDRAECAGVEGPGRHDRGERPDCPHRRPAASVRRMR